ncbi:uncharacterized protein F5891DRAFT_1185756 [Suillus fuscotomentosus]|uniref:Uncharacterized protein n=1 Tax=Suillus fuscotomentosus TaxID=1912939 RepID=A0AAD4EDW2_9AGAM|nr:uncharacterized protein F5891DRAFT_1185756 [Suillus fuscotomentosus]KAG1903123.1 hypothetical protein F5891DRAFT_1185756 [Suillus fuscotomentosus]
MNNNADANGGGGVGNQNAEGNQEHQIPQHLLQLIPRPRNVMFTMTERQIQFMYVTWAGARVRVRQELYQPELPVQPYPQPPVWTEETRAMIVLWIARERRIFQMEVEEMERLLGLRGAH